MTMTARWSATAPFHSVGDESMGETGGGTTCKRGTGVTSLGTLRQGFGAICQTGKSAETVPYHRSLPREIGVPNRRDGETVRHEWGSRRSTPGRPISRQSWSVWFADSMPMSRGPGSSISPLWRPVGCPHSRRRDGGDVSSERDSASHSRLRA
jgi:hypothetical protein